VEDGCWGGGGGAVSGDPGGKEGDGGERCDDGKHGRWIVGGNAEEQSGESLSEGQGCGKAEGEAEGAHADCIAEDVATEP